MFGSSMLDIAIGIIFVFLLLSVFATAINELILSSLNMRGKELLRGIQVLLNDTGMGGLLEQVYTHGQIYGLYRGVFDLKNRSQLPSYIPSRNFALALMDSITAHPAAVAARGAVPPPPPPVPGAAVSAVLPSPTAIVDATIAISDEFRLAARALAAHKATEKIGKPLVSMIDMAGNDCRKLQQSIEDWYNSGMDRVSGWYKYRTQRVLFVIGLVMAILLNADTINIVRQLSKDPTMRQAIVVAAQTAKPSPSTSASQPDISKQVQDTKTAFASVADLGVPLGWPNGPFKTTDPIWEAILGWLLTAVAVCLGAPFWFDTLNKIMVIRSTVKPREKSPEEPSKS